MANLIDVPSFLSDDDYGISLLASDCGSCQSTVESCGGGEHGSCSSCEGFGGGGDCGQSSSGGGGCSSNDEMSACGQCDASAQGGCSGGQCGSCQVTCMSGCQGDSEYEPPPKEIIVTVYTRLWNHDFTEQLSNTTSYLYDLVPGLRYTPSLHLPDYDDDVYELRRILYNNVTDYTTGSFICPSENFRLIYDFVKIKPDFNVDPWSWTKSNGQATAAQTQKAYQAVTSHGKISDFSYLVWNDLCKKVYDIKEAKGYNWNTAYDTFNNTKMTVADKVLTADRFNSLRYNVGIHVSTGIQEVDPGDRVLGRYFTTITDSLNNYIVSQK